MLAVPFLLLSAAAGGVLVQRFFAGLPLVVRLAGAFAASVVVSGWVAFLAAWSLHALGGGDVTFAGAIVAMLVNLAVVVAGRRRLRPDPARLPALRRVAAAVGGVAAALAVSFWIVGQRLAGDPLMVSANTWGDTGLHIGLARSFSRGDNFPPVLPIFSGEPIRYHFGLDFYAGMLERVGVPIGWAFNLPAGLGLAAIVVLVFELALHLWRSVAVGLLASVLFLTNGSLAFLRYFQAFPSLSAALAPSAWWHHDVYEAIAPYENGERISIFWTLNPYLTQTHLIVSFVLVLFVLRVLLAHLRGPGDLAAAPTPAVLAAENRRTPLPAARAVALGALFGASFWINGLVFIISAVLFAVLLIVYSGRLRERGRTVAAIGAVSVLLFVGGSFLASDAARELAIALLLGGLLVACAPLRESLCFLGPAGVLAVPQLAWLAGRGGDGGGFTFHNGYLIQSFSFLSPGSWWQFVAYWWLNLGLVGPLLILAAVLARRADRKLLVAVMAVFCWGNLIAFGGEIGGHNHKVFNLWETLANLFAAYALVRVARWLWSAAARAGRPVRVVRAGRAAAVLALPVALVLLVLSGLIDVMTLKNDPRYAVFGDAGPAIAWIEANTPRDAVFVAAYGDVYTIPTLAGRSVYVGGFDYWLDVGGYAGVAARKETVARIYAAPDRRAACRLIVATGADYVQVGWAETKGERFPVNAGLFRDGFVKVYSDPVYAYYDVRASCWDVVPSTGVAAGR